MPATWQVDADSFLETAHRLHEDIATRAQLFSQLFQEKHAEYNWNVVVNAEYVFHHGEFFINLTIIDASVPSKVVSDCYYMFSDKK